MAESIIEMAEKLGRAISTSGPAAKLGEARKELDGQKDVLEMLKQYQEQSLKIEQLEHENKPVEVEDKHRLRELHEKLVASDVFKRFTGAQVEYVDLMVRSTRRAEATRGSRKTVGGER